MLDLFRRENDPKDYFEYYLIPGAIIVGGLLTSANASIGDLSNVSGAVG